MNKLTNIVMDDCQPQTPTLMRRNPGESMWLTSDYLTAISLQCFDNVVINTQPLYSNPTGAWYLKIR